MNVYFHFFFIIIFFHLTNIRAAAVHRFLTQTNAKNITTTVAPLMDFLLVWEYTIYIIPPRPLWLSRLHLPNGPDKNRLSNDNTKERKAIFFLASF